jgi:hypothetical protein
MGLAGFQAALFDAFTFAQDSHRRPSRLLHIAIVTARYNKCVKAAIPLLATTLLCAQTPVKIDYACPPEDINSFGLACSAEDPCPVFLELSAVEAVGAKLFLAGNLHTQSATLRSILLTSEDGAKTWTEPFERIRAAAFEQIQFADFANGWVSGQLIEPLPRDPFLLLSTDGGKTWRQRAVFEESRIGTIADFWFESHTAGEMVIDHSERGAIKHEVYQTNTGGESWEMKEVTAQPVKLKGRPKEQPTWRIRADGASKAYHLERIVVTPGGSSGDRRGAPAWETIATILIHITDCK